MAKKNKRITYGKRKFKSNLIAYWDKKKRTTVENISIDDQNVQSSSNNDCGMSVEVESNPVNLFLGRRIVDFSFLLNQLIKINEHSRILGIGCELFQLEIIAENHSGFHSIITIQCGKCNQIFQLENVESKSEINLQAVAGIMSIGSRYSGLKTLFDGLDIPVMSSVLFEQNQMKVKSKDGLNILD